MYRLPISLCWLMLLANFGRVACETPIRQVSAAETDEISALIAKGDFATAEQQLRAQIPDPAAPVTSEAAIRLEILRRTRYDFSRTAAGVLSEIQQSIGDATLEDVERWHRAGDLHARMIDGEIRFFRRAVSNLFRFNQEAQRRRNALANRQSQTNRAQRFDLTGHIEQLVHLAAASPTPEVYPVRHRVNYELIVREGHPRVRPGALIRVWLPFPQEYRQQREIKLIGSHPPARSLAENEAPHRTLYFEETVGATDTTPRFRAEFEFVTAAYCPRLDPADVQPYDTESELYREYTSPRAPHILFTPEVRKISQQIVGTETNPLQQALLIFRWVSENVPWCAEMEYSIIPNLSAKGLAARRGDCGVQGMTFITLCRAAGVPARWQSGWQTRPGEVNMHDWSEFYVEPWGWLPADASYGVRSHQDPRVRDFLCGRMEPYRWIVNLDFGRPLEPNKISFRSEPNDFQRGEVEIDGHNLYFDEWTWSIDVDTQPIVSGNSDRRARE